MAKFPAATPGPSAGAGLVTPPAMMRVNSPGPDKPAGEAAGGIGWAGAAACCRSSVSLWINMVTLAGLLEGGGAGDPGWLTNGDSPIWLGAGSLSSERERNKWVSPPPLGAGSRLCGHAGSAAWAGALGNGVKGRTGDGAGGGEAGVRKSWVKLPSGEAESETPGVEKPLIFGAGGAANGAGSGVAGRRPGEVAAATNVRVNSPGSCGGLLLDLGCGSGGDGGGSSL